MEDVPHLDERCAPVVIGSFNNLDQQHALRDLLRRSSIATSSNVITVADSEDDDMGDAVTRPALDGMGDAGDEVPDGMGDAGDTLLDAMGDSNDEALDGMGDAEDEALDGRQAAGDEAVQDELHELASIAERAEVIQELAEIQEIVNRAAGIGSEDT